MTTIRLRGHIHIHTRDGHLTRDDTIRAWHATRHIAACSPIDLHIHGHITSLEPWAFTPIGQWLADASDVVVHANTNHPNAIHEAVQYAIDCENRDRARGGQ